MSCLNSPESRCCSFKRTTGYRGSNTFHNANRMTVKKVTEYVERCAYLSVYAEVGCVAPCLFHYGGEEDWRVYRFSIFPHKLNNCNSRISSVAPPFLITLMDYSFSCTRYGWCRPVDPFSSVGVTTSYSACAQACTAAGPAKCSSFARSDAGQCSLYVHMATNSSGESGVRCFTHKSHA